LAAALAIAALAARCRRRQPRASAKIGDHDLEIAVAEYIDWFNHRRLHGEIGLVPPVEYETQHHSTTVPEQPAQRQFHMSIKPGP
jgi:transposase InsO family protein